MPYKKGKTGRVARALAKKEPQLIEGPKSLLVVRGPSTSNVVTAVMHDLAALKKPRVKMLQRKNDIRPFEDVASLEFLADKNDCATFLYGSHSKKRPHNLVLGRMFDGHVMDMLELGVDSFVSLTDIKGSKKALGASPCMVFAGDEWDRSPDLAKLRNLLLDVFAARDLTGIALPALDHVLLVAVRDGVVRLRGFHMTFKRADGRIPRVALARMGPELDLRIRRTKHASTDLERAANRVPAQLKAKKAKNVSTDEFGELRGQIHMQPQDFGKLKLRKTGAYKVRGGVSATAGAAASDDPDAHGDGDDDDVDADDVKADEDEEENHDDDDATGARASTRAIAVAAAGTKRRRGQ